MSKVKIQFNKNIKNPTEGADYSLCSKEYAESARNFHLTFKEYQPTPLVSLDSLAEYFGLGKIFVKDESSRFGLKAFKSLGVSYAVGGILAGKLGKKIDEVSAPFLASKEAKEKIGEITFASTTDGNHGRGLAWAAEQFNQKAIIYMPKGSDVIRRDNIRKHGAECEISDLNYDDCVRMAWQKAQENGWITVQDTAWDGYTEIPTSIMRGYTTLCLEILEQMMAQGFEKPTHIFLQAGVGCFAGAVVSFFMSVFGAECPSFIIVEPNAANCFYVSACKGDGKAHAVGGSLSTLMAGLACGEPNPTSFEMLRDYPLAYASCEDSIAAQGMRILANPLPNDTAIVSGESGAATMGFLSWLMLDNEADGIKERLQITNKSIVLCISTEGDTSEKTYRDIVCFNKESL